MCLTLISGERGVSLLESMISLFIFSIGVLGLAALQLTSLSSTGDSQQRSLAIWKAQELADRIRANPTQLPRYLNAIDNSDLDQVGVDRVGQAIDCAAEGWTRPATQCAAEPGATAVSCSAEEVVQWDVWEVFCEPASGAAVAGNDVAQGTAALPELTAFMHQNTMAADGNSDVELLLQWLARESDANQQLTTEGRQPVLATDLCGRDDVPIDARLDVYCLRFRP